ATLNATVNPNGLAGPGYFQFGLTTNYGNATDATDLAGNITPQPVSRLVAGLSPGTLYHFRAVAVNLAGTNFGNDLTFTTIAIPPPQLNNFTLLANGQFR